MSEKRLVSSMLPLPSRNIKGISCQNETAENCRFFNRAKSQLVVCGDLTQGSAVHLCGVGVSMQQICCKHAPPRTNNLWYVNAKDSSLYLVSITSSVDWIGKFRRMDGEINTHLVIKSAILAPWLASRMRSTCIPERAVVLCQVYCHFSSHVSLPT